MVFFLVFDILNNISQLRVAVRKSSKPFLPLKIVRVNLFSLINVFDDFFISLIRSDRQHVGLMPIKKWMWLLVPLIASIFCPLF